MVYLSTHTGITIIMYTMFHWLDTVATPWPSDVVISQDIYLRLATIVLNCDLYMAVM